jgi:hypothetical protein
VALAVPTPPLRLPARAPAPAPTFDLGGGCVVGGLAEAGVRVVGEATAAAQVEDHRAGDDRHHFTRTAHRDADAIPQQSPGHPVGGREPEGGAAAEDERVDPLHEVLWVEQVGLAGAGAAAADVDTTDRSLRRSEHDGRAGQPAVTNPLGLTDPDPGDVGDRVPHPRATASTSCGRGS